MTGKPSVLLDIARETVSLAEEYILRHRPTCVTVKGDRDTVTDVDIAVERLVRDTLSRRTPGVAFLGEEEGAHGGDGRTGWVLDPVDGTANFVRALPLCGISLAFIDHGAPVVGAITLPFLSRRYWAAVRLGAWRDGVPIRCAEISDASEAVIAVGDYGTGHDAGLRNNAAFALHRHLACRVQRLRMLGSAAVDLAFVADGTLDASITFGNAPWDMAAGTVIAREASALVLDSDGSRHTRSSRTTLALAPGLRAPVLTAVRAATIGTPYAPMNHREEEKSC